MSKKKKITTNPAFVVRGEILPTLVVDWSKEAEVLLQEGWIRGLAIPVDGEGRPLKVRKHGKSRQSKKP